MPQNDRAKLADVGMAKLEVMGGRGAGRLRRASVDYLMTTFAWAAPEMLLGLEQTDAVDIYSLGVVLWEIATHVSMKPARSGVERSLGCGNGAAVSFSMCVREGANREVVPLCTPGGG